MNSIIAKYFVFFPVQFLRGEKVKLYLHQVRPIERFPLEQIETIQLRKLRQLVDYAYRYVPYYSELFDAARDQAAGHEHLF